MTSKLDNARVCDNLASTALANGQTYHGVVWDDRGTFVLYRNEKVPVKWNNARGCWEEIHGPARNA